MANTSSAKKQIRAQARKQVMNKARSHAFRDSRKEVKLALANGDKAEVEKALTAFYKSVDKASKAHTVHANTAARYKSRLTKLVNQTLAAGVKPAAVKVKAKAKTKAKAKKK